MSKIANGIAILAVTVGMTAASAAVIQPTVELPASSGAYVFGPFCLTALSRCTTGATVGSFTNFTHTQSSGNELVTADAVYTADIYTDNSGSPGLFIGTLVMNGFINVIFVGRNPSVNPLGTFPTVITDFSFSGLLGGNTFEIKQDPGQTSDGTTSIFQFSAGPPVVYSVTSTVDLFAQYSFNGSPFTSVPERTGELSPVPEPGTSALGLSAFGCLLAGVIRQRRLATR